MFFDVYGVAAPYCPTSVDLNAAQVLHVLYTSYKSFILAES